MCLGFGKKEREEIGGKRYGAFPSLFLSLSLSCPRNEQLLFRAKRATTKNDTTRHYVCSTKHEFYRRESCRGEIRQDDDATVRLLLLRVVFGARIPGVFLVCVHFCALNWSLSLSLSDGMMTVRISSRPEKSARARARASFFPAFRRRRVRKRSRRVGGGSSIQSSVFFFFVVSLTLFGRIVLSLFHISLPQNRSVSKISAKYGDESVYFDLGDVESTTGSWDVYGVESTARYPDQQAKFFENAAQGLGRREAMYSFVALGGAGAILVWGGKGSKDAKLPITIGPQKEPVKGPRDRL